MLSLILRILLVILLVRVVIGIVRLLSAPRKPNPRRVPDPPRPPQRRPPVRNAVDAEFEDLEEDR